MPDSFKEDDNTQSHIVLTKNTMVSHYRIIEKIGEGGMGEVYLAEDTKLKRKVALKFLPPHLYRDEDYRNRFKREAQASAKLDHTNIVTIYEVSEYQGRPFFAMQYIEGKSLRDVIKGKELPLKFNIDLIIQICNGLDKAHDAGIVHRDIKPSNILIDCDDCPKILDFGLATVRGTEKLTKTGSTLGTIGYMSPEQVRGEEVDQRTDLFSLGIILYEMITGKAPFKEEYEAATMNAILQDTPVPLKRYKSDVSNNLQLVVDKALDKDKETRYQTVAGMLADLKRVKKELEPSGIIGQVDIPKKRYRKILIPSLVVVIAVLLLIFKPWKFEISSRQEAIAQENKLAIMYFDNLADPADSFKLGEITTNLLITDLSESEYVQVVSSQRLYDILKQLGREGVKKIDRNIATQVAQKANARWMLLGSILNMEPEIILTAQLIDVESGDAIASQRIEGQPGERIFTLVDSLTIEIKNDLSLPARALEEEDRPIMDVTTHSTEAYRYYLKGVEYGFKFYFKEAKEYLTKALQYDSTFAMAYYRLAGIVGRPLRDSLTAKAIKYSSHASKKEQYIIHSYSLYERGKYEEVIEYMKKKLKEYPDDKEAYYILGHIYKDRLDQPRMAIPYFNSVIELDPLFRLAYNQLAYLYNSVGQFEKSIWAINKYIEIAPDEPNPYDTRAEIYALNGKLDEAIASYEKANEIKSNFNIRNLANLYLFKQNYAKAESLYQIMTSDPNPNTRASGRTSLANIPIYQGRFKDALRILEIGIETDLMEKNEFSTLNKIVRRMLISDAIGDMDQAIDDMDQVIAEKSKSLELIDKFNLTGVQIASKGFLASWYVKTGDCGKADSIMRQLNNTVDTTNMEHLDYYYYIQGFYKFTLQKFDSASFYFEKTNQIGPAFNDQIMIARSYIEIGRLGDAVAMFENAIKRYDYHRVLFLILSVKAHYWLGLAYEKSGWTDKAIEQYETFLDIWKDADEGIIEIEDAKDRLARLKNKS
jgi:serine/threonine protein kinase/Flp pilus assembly protein TadD